MAKDNKPKKQKKQKKPIKIWAIATAIILVFAIAINVVLFKVPLVTGSLDLFFGGERPILAEGAEGSAGSYASKAEVLAAAENFVVEVEQEGITLLKNEGAALPLAASPKVSVFGKNSVNLVYSGSGSAGNSSSSVKTLYESLEAAGIQYNPTLKAFYGDNSKSGAGRPGNPAMTSGQRLAGFATGETPVASYAADVTGSYKDYADAAIVVISRIGGEGFDLPRSMATDFSGGKAVDGAVSADSHYLQLDANERDLLKHVEENFDKVVVILNIGSTMEIGELKQDEKIDAILWMGFPGSTGVMALGKVLSGAVNPSGHTVDTWAADFTQDPTWYNTGIYGSEFGNRYLYDGASTDFAFVNYDEGIYVGYRYWETRGYEEEKAGNAGWYDQQVVYPFGYGLTYTTFDWDVKFGKADGSAITAGDTLDVTVTVKNTGAVAGKDVVQLYYSAPFEEGSDAIEKAHVVLADFGKTDLIQPGATQSLTFSLPVRNMKSYDYADANGNGFAGYELDPGTYTLLVSSDAHTPKASAAYILAEGAQLATDSDARGTEAAVENRFDDVSAGIFGDKTYASYVSRKDFAGTLPQGYLADEARTLSDDLKAALDASKKRKYTTPDDGQPWQVTGDAPATDPVNNGIALSDMLKDADGKMMGKADFDDPRWEKLLDEIPLDEMKTLVGCAAFKTQKVDGVDGIVGKPMTIDGDGPSGFTSFISEADIYGTCLYQAEAVMGASWNTDLAQRMGEIVGEEGLVGKESTSTPYSGWYAPAVNIHRSPFAGRNWEYYSEDGVLSGKLAAKVVEGAQSKGLYCYVKHFAINDQETDREYNGILVWANEQAMREIYLKPFELTVKESDAHGMMSSFNRIGMKWAGGSYPLLTEILRNEWGFQGMVITDYSLNTYTHVDEMIRAGGDLFLTQEPKSFNMADDATQIALLRKATKNILYTVVNSNAMGVQVLGYAPAMWKMVANWTDVGLAGLLLLGLVLAILKDRKLRKARK
ncbi:MAG: glycoside hydrolase family 3 C-terminal domain-containing protein [Clostridia bacterium]|nr:glycoside hydrolase family 3 C-terminal domain-containing protein [Clostridia bacterium]